MIVMLASSGDPGRITDASSRGILTGIGFLGAGVIFHIEGRSRIHGLTSAACTWLTACVGILCGAGQWRLVGAGLAITFVILLFGGPTERFLHRILGGKVDAKAKDDPQQPLR
eukprot:gene5584-7572_t